MRASASQGWGRHVWRVGAKGSTAGGDCGLFVDIAGLID